MNVENLKEKKSTAMGFYQAFYALGMTHDALVVYLW